MKTLLAVLLLLGSQSYGQVNLKQGLRLYLPFSGNAKDESGYNNHPVFNNATLTADRFGNAKTAYRFNGRNTYMKILNNKSINMGNKMSISLWVKPMGFYKGKCYNNMMLIKGDADYLEGNYSLRFSDAYTGCTEPTTKNERFYDGSGLIAQTPLVKLNQWYHVTVTYDGKTSRLYINCILQASYPSSVSFKNAYDLYIGHLNNQQYPYWLNGDLDEIRIYDRPLSKEEIQALCNQKPEVKEPPYVKAKEKVKKKDVAVTTKKQSGKTDTATTPPALPSPGRQEEALAGFIKLSDYQTQQEIVLQDRKKETTKEITVDSDSISVTLYDNGEIDGDSVTLIYNDKVLTTHQRLTDKPLTFWIKIIPGNDRNELIMYAENLGSIPPNTALMVIYDGEKRYEVNIKSTEKTNGSVSFKLRE